MKLRTIFVFWLLITFFLLPSTAPSYETWSENKVDVISRNFLDVITNSLKDLQLDDLKNDIPEPRPVRIAILSIEENLEKDLSFLKQKIKANLSNSLIQLPQIKLLDRSDLKEITKEQSLQNSAAMDERTAVQLGRMLGTQFLVLIHHVMSTTEIGLYVKVINTETGGILASSKMETLPLQFPLRFVEQNSKEFGSLFILSFFTNNEVRWADIYPRLINALTDYLDHNGGTILEWSDEFFIYLHYGDGNSFTTTRRILGCCQFGVRGNLGGKTYLIGFRKSISKKEFGEYVEKQVWPILEQDISFRVNPLTKKEFSLYSVNSAEFIISYEAYFEDKDYFLFKSDDRKKSTEISFTAQSHAEIPGAYGIVKNVFKFPLDFMREQRKKTYDELLKSDWDGFKLKQHIDATLTININADGKQFVFSSKKQLSLW